MAPGLANPLRRLLRFAAHVLIVSGILLIIDAGVTLAWQEPISAFTAERNQSALQQQLEKPAVRERVISRDPVVGDAIGRIELPTIDARYWVVEGTDPTDLRKGPGHYDDTPLPGERGTVAIAGHRTTYGAPFRNIDKLRKGDPIILEMPYGTFTYRVEKTRIVEPTALEVKRKVTYNRLILSACHPLYSADQRIVTFARFVSKGPPRVG
jgi:sortase A